MGSDPGKNISDLEKAQPKAFFDPIFFEGCDFTTQKISVIDTIFEVLKLDRLCGPRSIGRSYS